MCWTNDWVYLRHVLCLEEVLLMVLMTGPQLWLNKIIVVLLVAGCDHLLEVV